MAICSNFLHIVSSIRKVCLNRCRSILIERNNLDKAICENGSAAGRYDFLGGEQPKGNILHLTVCADIEAFILLNGLHKTDFHLLTFVFERSRSFGHSHILTGIDKLHETGFRIENHTVRSSDFTHLIFTKVEFTAHSYSIFIGNNGINNIALMISDGTIRGNNILCGNDLIDRTRKPTLFVLRLIYDR